MDNLRDQRSIVDNTLIDLCAGFFQKFVITREEQDLTMFLEIAKRLPLEKRKEVIKTAADNIRRTALLGPLDEVKLR